MTGEPSLQVRSASSSESALEPKNDNPNTRLSSSSGYGGGISEKISRLNDILKSLEARRNSSTLVRYDSPDAPCPPRWPPSLHNPARLLDTRAALERSSTPRDSSPHGAPLALSRTTDTIFDTLPLHSAAMAPAFGYGGRLSRSHRTLRGGRTFDLLPHHQHLPKAQAMLRKLPQMHHDEEHGLLDMHTRHPHPRPNVMDRATLDRLSAREYGVLDTLMKRHHLRGDGGPYSVGSHHVEGCGGVNTVNQHHSTTPRACSSNGEMDYFTPTYPPWLIRGSPAQRHHNTGDITHGYYRDFEPSQYGYFSPPGDPHCEKQRAASSTGLLSHDKECTDLLNMTEMAHKILSRLERLEKQQKRIKRSELQRQLAKKGAVCKVGGDRKFAKQHERGLLQAVRRRSKNGTINAGEGVASPSDTQNGITDILKRVQRVESELELCWSAINQLCIDNEQFREEQRRFAQKMGPLHSWSNNNHAQSSCRTHTSKDDFMPTKKGGRTTHCDDSILQNNDLE